MGQSLRLLAQTTDWLVNCRRSRFTADRLVPCPSGLGNVFGSIGSDSSRGNLAMDCNPRCKLQFIV